MTACRALKKLICSTLIGSLLFSQLAVAAYACPNAVGMKASAHSSSAMTARQAPDAMWKSGPMSPGCDQIDRDAVNLCVEQCNFGSEAIGSGHTFGLPAPIVAVLYFLPANREPTLHLAGFLRASDAMLAASPPPHAILHCVFLI